MRFSRLFVFPLVFAAMTATAQAQYTSKSTTTNTAASKTPTQAKTRTNTQTTGTNPYTGSGTKTTAAAPAAKQQPAQPTFRPRPQQQPVAMPQTEGDDELPSFDALEKPVAAAQGSAQGSNLPPPPPPKGEIWFYIANGKYRDSTGLTMHCTWEVVLQNKTDTPLQELHITYSILGENSPLRYSNIAPNGSKVNRHGIYSEKCPAITQSKPKIQIVSCKLGTIIGQDCMKYIVIK